MIPAEETKNGRPYEVELPKETVELLELYLKRYRPRLAPEGAAAWMFPNEAGLRRSTIPFSTGISAFVRRETGIQMNTHLFRHLAATLYLNLHSGDIETPRRVLGHASTTLRYHAEVKNASAIRHFDSVIAALREQAIPARKPRGRS
ncbi:site-specific integrase [Geminicoccus flavidas]|uniref:site-specific integrase n=1 Tax=Geminicoccus flavidas TaxID=2506407 RepID=UPI00135B8C96|nr:site-specific integrase [Geminicoccus flavidas]